MSIDPPNPHSPNDTLLALELAAMKIRAIGVITRTLVDRLDFPVKIGVMIDTARRGDDDCTEQLMTQLAESIVLDTYTELRRDAVDNEAVTWIRGLPVEEYAALAVQALECLVANSLRCMIGNRSNSLDARRWAARNLGVESPEE
jgi:hypothetical protein